MTDLGKVPSSKNNRILCFLRVRPQNLQERNWISKRNYGQIHLERERTPNPKNQLIIRDSGKEYNWDGVFWEDSQQREIFKTTTVPTLENVFDGYCGAVIAYGQTGTGKTHTMQGYGTEGGMIPLAANYIFNRVQSNKNIQYEITCSFLQIYLDRLEDLFNPTGTEIQIDPEAERVKFPGIIERPLNNAQQMMTFYIEGERHRITRKTKMNETSSRGHIAFIVNIKGTESTSGRPTTKVGKLVLIDLAGYERFTQTGVTGGIAEQEAKKINSSLLALGSVVNALADKDKHIPFRNSKLTRLCKDCLGGTAKTSIICTIGPCDKYKQETIGTLYFGWRAMAVKVNPGKVVTQDSTLYISSLQDKIKKMQERMRNMAICWHSTNPQQYEQYCAKYGDPGVEMLGDIDFTDVNSSTGMTGAHSSIIAAVDVEGTTDLLLAQERQEVKVDLGREAKRYQNERGAMVQMHQEQETALRQAGANPQQLAKLREENQAELKEMEEIYGYYMRDILESQQKREMASLLQNAINDLSFSQEQKNRIREMVEHLMNTCENKNEMLSRLFELVCHLEEKTKDKDSALMAAHKSIENIYATNAKYLAEREAYFKTQLMLAKESSGPSKRMDRQ